MTTSIPVLISPEPPVGVALPMPGENLFRRLIRSVENQGRPPKERECTEMLASVLINAPLLRQKVLEGFLSAAGKTPVDLGDLSFTVKTEQAVGTTSKRDDLRIEGVSEDGEPLLLVTVEVKVGSDFHSSTAEEVESPPVHQIAHYDKWLHGQSHKTKLGVVVTRDEDMGSRLPLGLSEVWRVVTWAKLGRLMVDALTEGSLPSDQSFLASHFAGFVDDQLGGLAMDSDQISFDDVALLRAVKRLGKGLNSKVDSLVAPLKGVIETEGIGTGETKHQKKVLEGHLRSIVYRSVGSSVEVCAGVVTEGGVDVAVWLECGSKSARKSRAREIQSARLSQLQERDPRWHLPESKYWDLAIRLPVNQLLVVDKQDEAVQSFVTKALLDLKEVGIFTELEALG